MTPVTAQTFTPGDVNGDGRFDIFDVQGVINQALGITATTPAGNVNGNGGVDVLDVQLIINIALGITPPPPLRRGACR